MGGHFDKKESIRSIAGVLESEIEKNGEIKKFVLGLEGHIGKTVVVSSQFLLFKRKKINRRGRDIFEPYIIRQDVFVEMCRDSIAYLLETKDASGLIEVWSFMKKFLASLTDVGEYVEHLIPGGTDAHIERYLLEGRIRNCNF